MPAPHMAAGSWVCPFGRMGAAPMFVGMGAAGVVMGGFGEAAILIREGRAVGIGAEGRSRTADPRITGAPLWPLSYFGVLA